MHSRQVTTPHWTGVRVGSLLCLLKKQQCHMCTSKKAESFGENRGNIFAAKIRWKLKLPRSQWKPRDYYSFVIFSMFFIISRSEKECWETFHGNFFLSNSIFTKAHNKDNDFLLMYMLIFQNYVLTIRRTLKRIPILRKCLS